jgi:hypothetical protein
MEAQPPYALCSLNLCAFCWAVLYPNLLSGSGGCRKQGHCGGGAELNALKLVGWFPTR